ncbi:MAG: glycosyltransferase family 2 protein [Candidatus Omnitrophica bacterium]|nr:glycosyltransferase family 2 protein [Candidatus Omnitrophota bacterium]
MKTCVILPAYNEAENISKVIKDIKALGIDTIVVDDGSGDSTRSIAEKEATYILSNPKRRGKGAALKDGFDYAKANGYDIMITIDADGQHDPSEIPLFLKKFQEAGPCVVIGNRLSRPSGMPPVRIYTNRFMSRIISALCRQPIPDTQCGYRLFPKEAIASIDIEARKFEIDSELLVKLSRKGYRIESLPIRSIYGGETSQINPITDAIRFIRFLLRVLAKHP